MPICRPKRCRRPPTRPASSSRAPGRRPPSPPAALAPQRPPGGHRPAPGATPPRRTRLGPLASFCRSGIVRLFPRPPRGASGQGLRPGSPAPSALPRPSPAQVMAQQIMRMAWPLKATACSILGCHQFSSHRKTFIQEQQYEHKRYLRRPGHPDRCLASLP